MTVKQTLIWFVLLWAFVVNGPNLKVTVDIFICFPLRALTFYLRSVLKHQAIHLKKCGVVCHVWKKSSKVASLYSFSLRLCGTNFCAHLLLESVWNKLLRTSPSWVCVEQSFAHISLRLCGTNFCAHLMGLCGRNFFAHLNEAVEQTFSHISMRLCGTNVCTHLLHEAVWNRAHMSSMRLCGTNFCAHLLHEAVWKKLLCASPWGCVEQTFAHISSVRLCGTNFCAHLLFPNLHYESDHSYPGWCAADPQPVSGSFDWFRAPFPELLQLLLEFTQLTAAHFLDDLQDPHVPLNFWNHSKTRIR
jgi:hypothetical protein